MECNTSQKYMENRKILKGVIWHPNDMRRKFLYFVEQKKIEKFIDYDFEFKLFEVKPLFVKFIELFCFGDIHTSHRTTHFLNIDFYSTKIRIPSIIRICYNTVVLASLLSDRKLFQHISHISTILRFGKMLWENRTHPHLHFMQFFCFNFRPNYIATDCYFFFVKSKSPTCLSGRHYSTFDGKPTDAVSLRHNFNCLPPLMHIK